MAQPHHTLKQNAEWYDVLPEDPLDSTVNGGFIIASCYGPRKRENAELIAAAPKTLALLRELFDHFMATCEDPSASEEALIKRIHDHLEELP